MKQRLSNSQGLISKNMTAMLLGVLLSSTMVSGAFAAGGAPESPFAKNPVYASKNIQYRGKSQDGKVHAEAAIRVHKEAKKIYGDVFLMNQWHRDIPRLTRDSDVISFYGAEASKSHEIDSPYSKFSDKDFQHTQDHSNDMLNFLAGSKKHQVFSFTLEPEQLALFESPLDEIEYVMATTGEPIRIVLKQIGS